MNKSFNANLFYCLPIIVFIFLLGCGSSASKGDDVKEANTPPIANAGVDVGFNEKDTVILYGEANDIDGAVVFISWSQLEGPDVSLINDTSINTEFIAPIVQETTTLAFELTATDNLGAKSSSVVTITINPVNDLPVVSAGEDMENNEGTTVKLIGEASDTDGEILSFSWVQLEGINVELDDDTAANTAFIAPTLALDQEPQLLVFELTAIDNLGAINTDSINITINPINEAPIANAGEDKVQATSSEVTLDCSQSYDPEGKEFSISWEQVSGSSITFNDNTSCLVIFNLPNTAEVFEFDLIVTDDKELSSRDIISITSTPIKLPLLTINNFEYQGAFRLPTNTFAESSLNYASAVITYNSINHSLFIVGHNREQSIAEFLIPDIVNSEVVNELNIAESPLQGFHTILNRAESGNIESIDRITGMSLIEDKLIVNAVTYYDADKVNTNTTLLLENPQDILASDIKGYYSLQGAAHAAGWISDVPEEWQPLLGKHLMGHASNGPINSRWSLGPSAFLFKFEDFISDLSIEVPTEGILDFSLATPLHTDRFNENGDNDLWTLLSRARYGFIVPNTKTYAVFGSSGGHKSGLGYKITQNNGNRCGGYCAYDENDYENYYWLWDVSDLIAVQSGEKTPSEIRPYQYGTFSVPFQKNEWVGINEHHAIAGGSYDGATGKLYLSISKADQDSKYTNAPIIITFDIVHD